jgi:hypothetical protein
LPQVLERHVMILGLEVTRLLKQLTYFPIVNWIKGPRGIIKITPNNALTPNDVTYKYEIVEVIDDFTKEQGVNVIPLLKLADFKAVFHRHTCPDVVRRIPKEELFRFSHQVPSCLLTGEERNDAPKGCHELEPAQGNQIHLGL